MTLYLDGIFDLLLGEGAPSSILIDYPIASESEDKDKRGREGSRGLLQGLLVSEPTLSTGVKWGPILNDVTNLQDVASLLGSEHMWSWIGASVMCWKGTTPLTTSIEFYLINYKRGLGLEQSLKELNYLTALKKVGEATVAVHGGYAARVLSTNTELFNNGKLKKSNKGSEKSGLLGEFLNQFKSLAEDPDMEEGTLRIYLGKKIKLRNMLLNKLDITPSIVEVPDGKPLYYRVSMSLTGSRPLLSTDVDEMYNL